VVPSVGGQLSPSNLLAALYLGTWLVKRNAHSGLSSMSRARRGYTGTAATGAPPSWLPLDASSKTEYGLLSAIIVRVSSPAGSAEGEHGGRNGGDHDEETIRSCPILSAVQSRPQVRVGIDGVSASPPGV
jgi:hypothetical protein